MHSTIYFNNKPLILSTPLTPEEATRFILPGMQRYNELTAANVQQALHDLESHKGYGVVFEHEDGTALLQAFKDKMTVLIAAGGLIYTPNNKVLLIYRLKKWDLPKGKLDEGEDLQQCALREVREETGLEEVQIGPYLTTTYHTYRHDEKLVLKEAHWYLMQSAEAPLTPQTEEDIEECKWVPVQEMAAYAEDTYPAIRDVLQKGMEQLSATKEM